MIDSVAQWYESLGFPAAGAESAAWWSCLAMLMAAAVVLHFMLKFVIVRVLRRAFRRWLGELPERIAENGVLRWLSHLVPAIFIHRAVPEFLGGGGRAVENIQSLALLYLLVAALLVFYSLANAFVYYYERRPMARELPATAFVQVVKLVLALIALVLAVSVMINRSPLMIFSGLGAMTAVLLLIFKDAILGFVAGIQLVANRMIAVGDWIEMPKYGADGDVEEVALTTVKVRNWDRTRTTIPTYALISDSFKNWRGMTESGGRRIKRCLYIDLQSVRLLDDELRERLGGIFLLKPYFEMKEKDLDDWHHERGFKTREESGINGRHLTNIGTFRAYIEAYLKNHPKIHQQMTLLVRHMPPDERGLPVEIYCFTNDIRWAFYESIQADIFDHLIAMTREFDLRIYQRPSGSDLRSALPALG